MFSTFTCLVLMLTATEAALVLNCSNNATPNQYSGAFNTSVVVGRVSHLSVCIRLSFEKLRAHNLLFDLYEAGARPFLQLGIYVDKLRYAVSHEYKYIMLKGEWFQPQVWYHICITKNNNEVNVYLQGDLIQTDNLTLNVQEGASILNIGYVDPARYPGLKFVGSLTQFNVWKQVLSHDLIRSLALCQTDITGDVVAWEESSWTVLNSNTFSVPLESLCSSRTSFETQLFPGTSFYEGAYICEGLGGSMIIPRTIEEVEKTILQYQNEERHCHVFWVGIFDMEVEGVWRVHSDGSSADYLPWAPDEPNGLQFENCGGVDYEGIVDDDCSSTRCSICEMTMGKPWKFLGSCQDSLFDESFLLEKSSSFRAVGIFRGFGDYVIELNEEDEWQWLDSYSGELLATLLVTGYNYPIGRQWWQMHKPVCGSQHSSRQLLLTSCTDGYFTCDDATCRPIAVRCDQKFDCRDHSDENECQILHLSSDYQDSIPPRDAAGNLTIAAKIQIENLIVDTQSTTLRTTFNLTLEWFESRATFSNLKDDISLNIITLNETLWFPTIAFANTIDHSYTKIDNKMSTFVKKEKRSSSRDNSIPEEVEFYPGSSNTIINHRQYQGSFTCDFDFTLYPFDHQTCRLVLQLRDASFTSFDLAKSSASYRGGKLLMEYEVGTVKLALDSPSTLVALVPLTRLHGYAFINIYTPSLTMLLIAFLTLFFRRQFFDTRVMTSLTTLLVMATLFSQTSAALPNTSYFKMVDVWLLFCIFTTFIVIVFHALIERDSPVNRAPSASGCARKIFNKKNVMSVNSSVKKAWANERNAPGMKDAISIPNTKENRNVLADIAVARSKETGNLDGFEILNREKIPREEVGGMRTDIAATKLSEKSSNICVSMRSSSKMELFGRVFISLVMVIFNLVYWGTIYSRFWEHKNSCF